MKPAVKTAAATRAKKVSDEEIRISFCIFSYNQADFIKEAILSVLGQSVRPGEVIISDDASTDGTPDVIRSVIAEYGADHNIITNLNVKNMGIGAHFSYVFNSLASGNYIINLGGDDICKPNHVETALRLMKENPGLMMIDFSADTINGKGEIISASASPRPARKYTLEDYLALRSVRFFAPGRIFDRKLFQEFPGISEHCPTEDSVIVLRSLLRGGFLRVFDSTVQYRRHETNASGSNSIRSISHDAIVSQYLKDITYSFDRGDLSTDAFRKLLKRMNYEVRLRSLKYRRGEGLFAKIRNKILIKLHTLSYNYL